MTRSYPRDKKPSHRQPSYRLGRVLINHDCSTIARCRKTTRTGCAGCSGELLPPSPPAENATAREDEAGQASTSDGTGNTYGVASSAVAK